MTFMASILSIVDRMTIRETNSTVVEHGQEIQVLRIKTVFPWRCQAMVTEYMFEEGSPRRLYLNGRRLM